MGRAVTRRQYLRNESAIYARPLVFCCEVEGITDRAVSMNVTIAQRLIEISSSMRSMQLEPCFVSALFDLPENVVIRDIDVLFNPMYEVDVVGLLCSAFRKHQFDLVWPGRFENDQLIYAEEGCPDYRAFNACRYDITCIY